MCMSHNASRDLLLPSKQGPPPWQCLRPYRHELAKTGLGRALGNEWTAERKKQNLKLKKYKTQNKKQLVMKVMGGIILHIKNYAVA